VWYGVCTKIISYKSTLKGLKFFYNQAREQAAKKKFKKKKKKKKIKKPALSGTLHISLYIV